MWEKRLKKDFPKLTTHAFKIESPADPKYNCIAWAAEISTITWWPSPFPSPFCTWPRKPKGDGISEFIEVFESMGYSICASADREEGCEKVAIYANKDNQPTHMARQLPSGLWTSKCGRGGPDISHAIEGLEGDIYGDVKVILKRSVECN